MTRNRRWRFWTLVFTFISCASAAYAAPRTWTSKSGKTITADLVGVQHGNVVLLAADGRQLTVSVKQLSTEDQAFVEGLSSPGTERRSAGRGKGKGGELATIAESFFNELRSEKREVAGEMLTTKAQEVLKGGKSPLASLPAPEEGERSIRVGRQKIDKETAEIPVQVKSASKLHKVKLHFRKEDDQWRICAMSAMYPEGEKMVDLEADALAEGEGDSLEALIGKQFQFSGVTLDGKPLDVQRYQGKVVLFAFWVGAARQELANVFTSYQKHYHEGFDVISVNMDDDLLALAEHVRKERPPWVVVADKFPGNRQQMGQIYQISTFPTSILVGRDGNVVAVDCTGKKLEEELAKLLAAKPAEPKADGANAADGADTKKKAVR